MNVQNMSADERSAESLLAEIRARGGKLFRYSASPRVFCITRDAELAAWLRSIGGRPFSRDNPDGSYLRARDGIREWDTQINMIAVSDESPTAIWEAAAR